MRKIAVRSKRRPAGEIRILFDGVSGGQVFGWAARVDRSETAEDKLALRLLVCGQPIGEVPRETARPDVDAHIGHAGPPKGFSFHAPAVLAFSAMAGGAAFAPVELSVGENMPPRPVPEALINSASDFEPIRFAQSMGNLKLADLWFAGDGDLRLRIERRADGDGSLSLSAYQVSLEPHARFVCVLDATPVQSDLAFVGIPVLNPLLPVLLVLRDAAQVIRAIDTIPFPSLCRGGLHYPELRAASVSNDDFQDLRVLSRQLFREYIGWTEAPPRRVGTLVVSLKGATGNERIFAPDTLEWLSGVAGVQTRIAGDGDPGVLGPDVQARLEAAASLDPMGAQEADELTLPCDAVPTIAALLMRDFGKGRQAVAACPYLISPQTLAGAAWAVGMPRIGSWVTRLQPSAATTPFPILKSRQADAAADELPLIPARPMAIRYPEGPTQQQRSALSPIDMGGRRAVVRKKSRLQPSLSVCISLETSFERTPLLLESLSQQDFKGQVEVILATPGEQARARLAPIQATLNRLFDGRHSLVPVDAFCNTAMLLNAAAETASGSFLLFAGHGVLLQDIRAVGTLVQMAGHDDVASASCLLLQPNRSGLQFGCAGYFVTGLSTATPPSVIYEPLDCAAALEMTTYPVVANSSTLLATRTEAFVGLGGFDHQAFPGAFCDLDYGIRAVGAGLTNLCTTTLAAYTDTPVRGGHADVDLLHRLPSFDLGRLATSVTMLRKVL